VYAGAKADGKVVAEKCTNAIENYKAAVSCFVRALPSLQDERSAELVRAEIRRLMARLGELGEILRNADPDHPLAAADSTTLDEGGSGDALNNRLLQDLRFQVGDEVEVDETRPGVVSSVDLETGTYGIQYDDGTRETGVPESRVRTRTKPVSLDGAPSWITFKDANDFERYKLWSEIVESERVYRDSLNHLVQNYIIPLDSPMQWAGTKSKNETVFSQKSITKEERVQLFGNVEDIAGTSVMVFDALEKRFTSWESEQKLADIFLEFSSLFLEGYPLYAETVYSSIDLLKRLSAERGSFEAVIERAKLYGAPPLEDLLRAPLTRPAQYKRLLQSLAHRTNSDHPDSKAIRDSFVLMGKVEEAMELALNRLKLEAQLLQIEQTFAPAIKIARKGRYLVKFDENLKRIEGSTTSPRCVWLFNDLVIVGRKSEWFNKGQYRHLGQFFVTKARAAPEYGPLAFEIAGKSESWIFVAFDDRDKHEWLQALRGFIATKTRVSERRKSKANAPPAPPPSQPLQFAPPAMMTSTMNTNGTTSAAVPSSSQQQPKLGGVGNKEVIADLEVALGAATLRQKEILQQKKSSERSTPSPSFPSPPAPSPLGPNWYRARALYTYQPQEIGDLGFQAGDTLELAAEEEPPGWTRGRRVGGDGTIGQVPTNYIERL